MPQDRRTFLSALGAAAVGLASRGRGWPIVDSSRDGATKIARVGIQLYTLRKEAAADLGGTLERLAKIGYKEIELAGYYNHPASEVRDMLRASGLTAPSAHIGIEGIEGTNASQTFADAKTIGLEWITVPSLPRGPKTTADD